MLNVSDLRNEFVISDDIVITDKEFIVEEIERLSGIKADMECIKNNILLNEYRKFYFNESLKKGQEMIKMCLYYGWIPV